MYYLTDFELNAIQKNLAIIKKCREDDSESISLSDLCLREIIGVYCPYGKLTEQVLNQEILADFLKNIDKCNIVLNNMYFKISYVDNDQQKILKATCLGSVMYAEEELINGNSSENIFVEDGEATVLHEDVIISKEMPSVVHRRYKIGPLKGLVDIGDEATKRTIMYKNKIEVLADGNPLLTDERQLYRYDMYSYIKKEDGKIIEKKA